MLLWDIKYEYLLWLNTSKKDGKQDEGRGDYKNGTFENHQREFLKIKGQTRR